MNQASTVERQLVVAIDQDLNDRPFASNGKPYIPKYLFSVS